MNNFYFLFLLFSDFIGILFSFYVISLEGGGRWWKDLEDDVRAYGYNMVTLR